MKVVIIDDEVSAIETLANELREFDNITLSGTAQNGIKGIALVKQEQPDLLFLDVELPDMSGLDFLKQMDAIAEQPCRVVIYTGHSNYMLQALRGRAFDFLLKPFERQDLWGIIQRAMIEPAPQYSRQPEKDPEKLLLYVNAMDFSVVNIRDVGVFQYNHDLRIWEVFVAGHQEPIRLKRSTNNDSLLAMSNNFVQVSQRHIININYLMEVNESVCRLFPPFDGVEGIKVGRTFRKKLTERFCAL